MVLTWDCTAVHCPAGKRPWRWMHICFVIWKSDRLYDCSCLDQNSLERVRDLSFSLVPLHETNFWYPFTVFGKAYSILSTVVKIQCVDFAVQRENFTGPSHVVHRINLCFNCFEVAWCRGQKICTLVWSMKCSRFSRWRDFFSANNTWPFGPQNLLAAVWANSNRSFTAQGTCWRQRFCEDGCFWWFDVFLWGHTWRSRHLRRQLTELLRIHLHLVFRPACFVWKFVQIGLGPFSSLSCRVDTWFSRPQVQKLVSET